MRIGITPKEDVASPLKMPPGKVPEASAFRPGERDVLGSDRRRPESAADVFHRLPDSPAEAPSRLGLKEGPISSAEGEVLG